MSGPFYDAWKAAVSETSGYLAYFAPWFEDDKYRAQVPKGFKRTPDEEEYCAEVFDYYEERLDDEQLVFRRQKIALDGPALFKQEYPTFPRDALDRKSVVYGKSVSVLVDPGDRSIIKKNNK